MKKTITCATTSLLLIGILTLQTLAINFKSEENIDNLVFPFIYSDADDLVWVRKYVGDCSTCMNRCRSHAFTSCGLLRKNRVHP